MGRLRFHASFSVEGEIPVVQHKLKSDPIPFEIVVRVDDPDSPYVCDVEMFQDQAEGILVVTGIAVRRKAEGTEAKPLSPRDVRRAPLSSYVEAAIAFLGGPRMSDIPPTYKQYRERLDRLRLPRGRPKRGETKFYEEIAEFYRETVKQQERPVREIARRKGVEENTVHQWIYKARELGLLELSPRSRKRRT